MRLYNIFYICKVAFPIINKIEAVMLEDDNAFLVSGWKECKKQMDSLKNIALFKDAIENLYRVIDWQIEKDEIRLSELSASIFTNLISEIKWSAKILLDLCSMLEIERGEIGIDIKIPKCDSLKEYMGYLKDIDFLFTQCPFLLNDKEKVNFNTVDVGSQWLSFVVLGVSGTFCILTNLAKLIQKALEIKSNILVCKQQEEALREMRQKNAIGEDVIDAFKKLKQITMDDCVSDLEGEIRELKDNEERDKVKRSVESLVLLMEKGVEIYSSIETPKEIKVLFPLQKDTALLTDDIIKLIEDKKDSSEA